MSLTALSMRAGLPKASALRIIRKLVEWGALERANNGEYIIGLRLQEVAALAPGGHGPRQMTDPADAGDMPGSAPARAEG